MKDQKQTAKSKLVEAEEAALKPILADNVISIITAHESSQQAKLKQVREALEKSQAGLQWYRSEHPKDESPADDEMQKELDEALALLNEMLAETQQPDAVCSEISDTEVLEGAYTAAYDQANYWKTRYLLLEQKTKATVPVMVSLEAGAKAIAKVDVNYPATNKDQAKACAEAWGLKYVD